jgi:Pheromone A receptor
MSNITLVLIADSGSESVMTQFVYHLLSSPLLLILSFYTEPAILKVANRGKSHHPVPFDIMTTSNHVFSIFFFISFIRLRIYPTSLAFASLELSHLLYILWVSLFNLICFINSVMWDGNVMDRSPAWCDLIDISDSESDD